MTRQRYQWGRIDPSDPWRGRLYAEIERVGVSVLRRPDVEAMDMSDDEIERVVDKVLSTATVGGARRAWIDALDEVVKARVAAEGDGR